MSRAEVARVNLYIGEFPWAVLDRSCRRRCCVSRGTPLPSPPAHPLLCVQGVPVFFLTETFSIMLYGYK